MWLTLLLLDAHAATLVVDGSAYTTIQDALDDAVDGDVIEVPAGTWYECLVVKAGVSIVGVDGSAATTLDGGGVCDVGVDVRAPGADVSLSGFTVTVPGGVALSVDADGFWLEDAVVTGSGGSGTRAGAGLSFTGATLSLTDATFSDNTAESCAAFDLPEGAVASISGGSFSDNVADDGVGGAICVGSDASLTVDGATFADNQAEEGGLTIDVGERSELLSTSNAYNDSHSGGAHEPGGAVSLAAGAILSSTEDTFYSNSGSDGSGISAQADGVTVTVEGGTFTENEYSAIELEGDDISITVSSSAFSSNPGDIWSSTAAVTLVGDTFEDTEGTSVKAYDLWDSGSSFDSVGGAAVSIRNDGVLDGTSIRNQDGYGALGAGGSLTLSNCTIEDNLGDDSAALNIREGAGPVTITGCTFARNVNESDSSLEYGGAISHESGEALTITDCVFEDNEAKYGGAIESRGGEVTVTDTVFSGNRGTGGGGAFWAGDSIYAGWVGTPAVVITGATFTDNSGYYGGTITLESRGSLEVSDSSFVENTSGTAGGAVRASDIDAVTLDNIYACGNTEGAYYLRDIDTVEVLNNILVENSSTGDGGAAEIGGIGAFTMSQATVLGNSAAVRGGALYLAGAPGSVTNSIFAWNGSVAALYGGSAGEIEVTYNDWYENTGGDSDGDFTFPSTGFGNTTEDPGLAAYSMDGDCYNDGFALLGSSALIDAGTGLDADGSAADIGATGGEDSTWTDGDGDGFLSDLDCDDADDAVSPGAEEVCDGLDDDCDGEVDGASAADAETWYADDDGDGYGDPGDARTDCEGAGEGWVGDAEDCDDGEASVYPGAAEIAGDGVDQDCDGRDAEEVDTGADSGTDTDSADDTDTDSGADSGPGPDTGGGDDGATDTGDKSPGCAGCTTADGSFSPLGVLLGLLAARRRRRS